MATCSQYMRFCGYAPATAGATTTTDCLRPTMSPSTPPVQASVGKKLEVEQSASHRDSELLGPATSNLFSQSEQSVADLGHILHEQYLEALAKWEQPGRITTDTQHPGARFRVPNFLDKRPELRFMAIRLSQQMIPGQNVIHTSDPRFRGTKRKAEGDDPDVDEPPQADVDIPQRLLDALDWGLTFDSCNLPPLDLSGLG